MLDQLIHRYLRIPYKLHMEVIQKPKKSRATVLLIHGIGSSSATWKTVAKSLPDDIKVVTVDLLGFGKSPKPEWVTYDAKRQAQSIVSSYRRKGLRRKAIIIGHSLGGLVAVEIAKQYPSIAKTLILCSPPFYQTDEIKGKSLPRREKVLREIYNAIHNKPDRFAKVTNRAIKYKLIDSNYRFEGDSVRTYAAALEASIVNQTSFMDVASLSVPVDIIHGSLDPVVVKSTLKKLVGQSNNIKLYHVRAGHEVKGKMIPLLIEKLSDRLAA